MVRHAVRYRFYRILALGLGILLCLGFDFAVRRIYLAWENKPGGRVAHSIYDHSLSPITAWKDRYGYYEAPYFSNSLGFRDGRIREVSLSS
jgi:hypothetical protein